MTKFISRVLFGAVVGFLFVASNFGQVGKSEKPQFSVFNSTGKGKPIVFAKETDGLPNKILAKGRIVQANVYGTYCGDIATGGTLKIRLSEKVEGYPNEYLYLIVLCLAGPENENLVGNDIEIEVRKMTEFPYSFGVMLANSIDSNATPFYLSETDGVGGLMKNLGNKFPSKK